jgi:hypothetical protein
VVKQSVPAHATALCSQTCSEHVAFDSLTEQKLLVVVCCGWPQSSKTGDVRATRLSAEQPHRSLGCYTAESRNE